MGRVPIRTVVGKILSWFPAFVEMLILMRSLARVHAWHSSSSVTALFAARSNPLGVQHSRFLTWSKYCTASTNEESPSHVTLDMNIMYNEWSLEQDRQLWEHHKNLTTAQLAGLLGRGLRGVERRLAKLKDVNGPAYERLFVSNADKTQPQQNSADEVSDGKKAKLVPAGEILRRIQWDFSLRSSDFSILYYDRLKDSILESPMDARNDHIKGSSTLFIEALPEHRIVGIKYKEKLVWDREKRLDLFVSNGGIESVISSYDDWKRNQDARQEWFRLRQAHMTDMARMILGLDRYQMFQDLSTSLQSKLENPPPGFSNKRETEDYVSASLELFRSVQRDQLTTDDDEDLLAVKLKMDAVDFFSEFVAASQSEDFHSMVLEELALVLRRLEGKSSAKPQRALNSNNQSLPEISEDDLTETFVRGTGAGGQKINKTSNKVVLLHIPTNLRVECQETRSLQQNRKIARKRLRIKLDEFLNGKQSRTNVLAEKAANKKAKSKARNRARNKKKADTKKSTMSD